MIRKKIAVKKAAPKKALAKPLNAGMAVQLPPAKMSLEQWMKIVMRGLLKGNIVLLTPAPKIVKIVNCAAVPNSLPVSKLYGQQVAWKNTDGHGHTLRFTGKWPFTQPPEDIKVPAYGQSSTYTVGLGAEIGKHKYMISASPGPGEPDIDVGP